MSAELAAISANDPLARTIESMPRGETSMRIQKLAGKEHSEIVDEAGFMELLVTQMKSNPFLDGNQDPTAMVTQMQQFKSTQALMEIQNQLASLRDDLEAGKSDPRASDYYAHQSFILQSIDLALKSSTDGKLKFTFADGETKVLNAAVTGAESIGKERYLVIDGVRMPLNAIARVETPNEEGLLPTDSTPEGSVRS